MDERDAGIDKAGSTGARPGLRLVEIPQMAVEATKAKTAQPPLAPLLYWKRDLCQLLRVKVRTLERMISSGEIPAPERHLRGRPAWLARTIHEWVEKKAPRTSIPA